MSTADLRSASVEQRRGKEHRVKYRHVNAALLGKPIPDTIQQVRSSKFWTDSNKFRMAEFTRNPNSCRCSYCSPHAEPRTHRRSRCLLDNGDPHPASKRKTRRPALGRGDEDDTDTTSNEESEEDDGGYAQAYLSFDHARGPGRALDLGPQVERAVERFETKELAALVKAEYDVVDESEGDEEFELV